MAYFVKITSSWTPSNSLKKYLAEQVKAVENKDVDTADEIFDWLNAHVTYANRRFDRCTPEKLERRNARTGGNIHISGGVFQVTLYPKAGPFVAEPLPKQPGYAVFDATKTTPLFSDSL